MNWIAQPPLDIVYRRSESAEPVDDRRLRRRIAQGEVARIGPGAFAAGDAWRALPPLARHAQRAWEASARMTPGRIFSHHAAAAVWGMDVLGGWPERIDVSGEGIGGSSGIIRRHERDPSTLRIVPWMDHFVTTPAQTAIDLAAALPFVQGVVACDQALWNRRPGGSLALPFELHDIAAAYSGRAHVRVRRVAAFARPGADSVRESESRVLIARLGFPEPVLQQRFALRSGRLAFADFWWPNFGHVGEFDGIGKYLDPSLRRGLTPQEVLIVEKDRGDELRREVRAVSRWRTPALANPRLLYDILTGDGLPSSRRRPGR